MLDPFFPFLCAPYNVAVSEDEVMMPHAFERLWGGFEPQGEFQTHITESVPQTTVVRHLNDRGFQVSPCPQDVRYPYL